jgi:hypothetical protein
MKKEKESTKEKERSSFKYNSKRGISKCFYTFYNSLTISMPPTSGNFPDLPVPHEKLFHMKKIMIK